MGNELRFSLCVTMLIAVTAVVACRRPELQAGHTAPTAMFDCAGEPCSGRTVAWVFREEDCLRCWRFQGAIRKALRHKETPPFDFVALIIADSVPPWLRSYFAKERLSPRLKSIPVTEYRRTFGDTPLPGLYLIRGNVIDAVVNDADETEVLAFIASREYTASK